MLGGMASSQFQEGSVLVPGGPRAQLGGEAEAGLWARCWLEAPAGAEASQDTDPRARAPLC